MQSLNLLSSSSTRRSFLAVLLAAAPTACIGDAHLDTMGDSSAEDDSGGGTAGVPTATGEADPTTGEADPTTGDSDGTSGAGPGEPPPGPPDRPRSCEPLPMPTEGFQEWGPDGPWKETIANAGPGATILLSDGVYPIYDYLSIPEGVTVRSTSGDRDGVVFELAHTGRVEIEGSNVTLADVTVRGGQFPLGVEVDPFEEYATGVLIHNVRIVDATEVAVQIGNFGNTDDGEIRCSSIEPAAPEAPYAFGAGVGIELGPVWGWTVRDNYVAGFGYGVHAYRNARDTVVERNVVAENAVGIMLGSKTADEDFGRDYLNPPYPGTNCSHIDGIARNNLVLAVGATPAENGYEYAGITVASACGVRVYNNTIVALYPKSTSIALRDAARSVQIANNLLEPAMAVDDGLEFAGAANLVDALDSVVDAAGGRLHLVAGSPAIDAGTMVENGTVVDDVDGDARDGHPDIGADEFE